MGHQKIKPTNELSPELAKRCTRLRELFAKNASTELKVGYEIAVQVHAVREDNERYGKRGVATIARELGRSAALLYSYANVAARWSPEAFAELAARRTSKDEGLTLHHFIEIARAERADVRDELIKIALSDALSVREVKRERTQRERKPTKRSTADVVKKVYDDSRALLKRAQQLAVSLDGIVESSDGDRLPSIELVDTLLEYCEEIRREQSQIALKVAPLRSRIARDTPSSNVAPSEISPKEAVPSAAE